MKIIFAGTPEFAKIQLNSLLKLKQHKVVAIYTQPDRPSGRGQKLQASPVKKLAQENKIPVEQPINFKDPSEINKLKSYNADVMVVAAYGLLLPNTVLNTPKYGCINVHASLLPKWRGAAPIQYSILSGDKKTGITLMKMDQGMDTGDMLWKGEVNITEDDTSQTLHDKLAPLGANALLENLEKIILYPNAEVQNSKLATYAPKIKKSDAMIQWDTCCKNIHRQIRAMDPWPGAFSFLNGKRIKIFASIQTNQKSTLPPGTIAGHDDNGIIVATKDYNLYLIKIQLPGKNISSSCKVLSANTNIFAENNVFSSQ
jgi:methionyl-tRNA formyltransferase